MRAVHCARSEYRPSQRKPVNSATVSGAETLIGGSLADTITLGTALSGTNSIDLGQGDDTLTLADIANTGSVSNVETLYGGLDSDTITFATVVSNGLIDLGGGSDTLTLGNFANTATIANVESIVGGSLADTITLKAIASKRCT